MNALVHKAIEGLRAQGHLSRPPRYSTGCAIGHLVDDKTLLARWDNYEDSQIGNIVLYGTPLEDADIELLEAMQHIHDNAPDLETCLEQLEELANDTDQP